MSGTTFFFYLDATTIKCQSIDPAVRKYFFLLLQHSKTLVGGKKNVHIRMRRTANRHTSSAIIIIRVGGAERREATDRELLGWEFRERAKLGSASSLRLLRGATVVFHLFQFPDTSEPWRTVLLHDGDDGGGTILHCTVDSAA